VGDVLAVVLAEPLPLPLLPLARLPLLLLLLLHLLLLPPRPPLSHKLSRRTCRTPFAMFLVVSASRRSRPSASKRLPPRFLMLLIRMRLLLLAFLTNLKLFRYNELLNLFMLGLCSHVFCFQSLSTFLPSGPVTAENLREHVRSAQFRQAVQMFNAALRSGQLNAMLASFGLSSAGANPNVSTIERT